MHDDKIELPRNGREEQVEGVRRDLDARSCRKAMESRGAMFSDTYGKKAHTNARVAHLRYRSMVSAAVLGKGGERRSWVQNTSAVSGGGGATQIAQPTKPLVSMHRLGVLVSCPMITLPFGWHL